MALSYQLTDKVRLVTAPIQSGILTIGLTVRATVYNADDGSILLNNVTLNSAGNGVYYYQWTHGRTTKTWCLVVYTILGLLSATAYGDTFTINDSDSLSLAEGGRTI